MSAEPNNKKASWSLLLIIILLVAGFALALYPLASELLNSRLQKQLAESYETAVQAAEPAELSALWQEAQEFNKSIRGGTVVLSDPFDETSFSADNEQYLAVLNPEGNGVMGTLEIPEISVRLAIYHTVEDEVMSKGVGHLPMTSLPVGGEGTHCVLSAHRGLPGARLFSDLDELEVGDEFYIHVLDRTLTYRIDQIKTVEPDEIADLLVQEGEDYVTLVTCTPYAVNTHRLLVRGVRAEPAAGAEAEGGAADDGAAEDGATAAEEDAQASQAARQRLPYGWQGLVVALLAAVAAVAIILRSKKRR